MSTRIRDMEYFAAIAEHGQVQRAAAALGLSQPALSKSLLRLERAIGARLLERTPKGVELTAVGSALLRQVRRLRLVVDDISREAAELGAGGAGELRIGTGPDFAIDLVPTACAAMVRAAPRVVLKTTVGTADILFPALAGGRLDLTVTASAPAGYDDLAADSLLEEEYAVYCSGEHRLARKKSVTLADLAAERWVLAVTEGALQQRDLHQIFRAAGLPAPTVAVETNSVPFRTHLLPSTDLLGFLPRRALQGTASRAHLRELRVPGLSYRRTVAVWHRRDAYLSPAALKFIEVLKDTAAGSGFAFDRATTRRRPPQARRTARLAPGRTPRI